jgi:hypothetical protein
MNIEAQHCILAKYFRKDADVLPYFFMNSAAASMRFRYHGKTGRAGQVDTKRVSAKPWLK